jgi:mono/diheme cytochrome c family protein
MTTRTRSPILLPCAPGRRAPLTLLALAAAGFGLAAAQDPIPVLLVGGQNNHDWKTGNAFIMALLQHPGPGAPAFAAVESDTPEKGAPKEAWAAWKPEFDKYRCVVLDYNGELWPEDVQRAFERYVAGGGGVVAVHASNNSFTGWAEYEKMIGLLWRPPTFGASLYYDDQGALQREEAGQGRPMGHGKQWDWVLDVRDAAHPIAAGMPKSWKHVKDELYHGQRGPAADVHVVLSAFSDTAQGGTGKHEPIVWWVPYGKGKVLTDVMGHVGETAPMSCVGFQTVLLRGIEWVATGRCTTPIPADFPTAERTSQRYPLGPPRQPIAELTPQQALSAITVPPGYHVELVASEPAIVSPVLCAWDGDGRMLVAEMRSYMLDVDGINENDPISRVSRLSSSKGDGVLDQVTVFADHLVLPRMVLPLDDRVVIAETYTGKFVSYRDSKGDGVADEKTELADVGPSKANLEHQDSALTWGIDNCIYTAQHNTRRFRVSAGGTWTSEPVYGSNSQWGLAMDDQGRLFSATAGGERAAYGFQQFSDYGALELPGETAEGFDETFPALQTVDVQGGFGRVHPFKGTLNHFTACAGQSIFRGDRLPADLRGDYILPEPVGRLVRRAKVQVVDGKRVLSNAYPGAEFITSTDPTFRPVWSATGPDGCLYIVDMHHGIIQEGAWTNAGSYLRGVVTRDGYDKYVGHGRIYRIVADGFKPGPKPAMLHETPAQLVEHLSHDNGWWRDTAQKLLVLKGDRSVVPALARLARSGASPLGRMHALWTLDGLEASDRAVVAAALADPDERVRVAAARIAERLLRKGDKTVVDLLTPLLKDKSMDVVVQAIDSLRYAPKDIAQPLLAAVITAHLGNEIVAASAQQSLQFDAAKPGAISVKIDPVGLALLKQGRDHFAQICFACHGMDGKGVVTSDGMHLAPPLSGSPRVLGSPEALVRIVLDGLVGDVDGKQYPGLMVPQKANDDQWLAEALTYVRNSFGNHASTITPADVARIRKAAGERSTPYTIAELAPYLAIAPETMRTWSWSASNNPGEVKNLIDGDPATRWATGKPQEPGQYLQFDAGKPLRLTRLVLDAEASRNDAPHQFEVRTSLDGAKWSNPVAKGPGKPVIEIELPPGTVARYVRITQTGPAKGGNFWSVHEISVFGAEDRGPAK